MADYERDPINIEPYLKRELPARGAPKQSYSKRLPVSDLLTTGWRDRESIVIEMSYITSLGERLNIAGVATTIGDLTTIHRDVTDVLIGARRGQLDRIELYGVDNAKKSYDPSRENTSIEIFFQGDSGRRQIVVLNNSVSGNPYNTPA